jgi:hypothetical protein
MNKSLQLTFLLCWSIFGFAQQPQYKLNQFTFEDTSGKKYNLDSLKGRLFMLIVGFQAAHLVELKCHILNCYNNVYTP